jgi:primary-amine oxidase
MEAGSVVSTSAPVSHPLEPLSAAEIERAVTLLRAYEACPDNARFACVQLHEPDKYFAANFQIGQSWNREAFAILMIQGQTYEAIISLSEGAVTSWQHIPGAQSGILLDEFFECEEIVKNDAGFAQTCALRGVTDMSLVIVDPWTVGAYGDEEAEGLDLENGRFMRAMAWVKSEEGDNGYARSLEGVAIYVDMVKNEVAKIVDYGVTPLPPQGGNWAREYFDGREGTLQKPLKPLEIVQPEGPTFEVSGHEVKWHDWKLRLDFWAREGLILRDISFAGRPIMYRASMCDMVVPYGDPHPWHAHKNAFDVGEYGLGTLANALELGCDCLGLIRYFDAHLVNAHGEVVKMPNAICMHEEDFGVLWKHTDWRNGQSEVRRSRRLVVSFWCTVANYEYGFFWYFYLDGNIEFEIKLSGIINTGAKPVGEETPYGEIVAPGIYAPIHQHFFNVRMDMSIDGTKNTVSEVHTERMAPGPDNPYKNGFYAVSTPIKTEKAALEVGNIDPHSARYWKISNPNAKNALGKPTAYKLMPGDNVDFMPHPDSSVGQRAGFAYKHLWVTKYEPNELYASGAYPNQHPGGAGLPEYVAGDDAVENEDIVVWYTFGAHHVVRAEDWPVMPTAYIGFMLKPVGFFNRNPAINLAPDEIKHSQELKVDGSVSGDVNGFAAPKSCCGS